jgi:hypothetical protein
MHLCHAELMGYYPHEVRINHDGSGYVSLVYPMSTKNFPSYFKENPALACQRLAEIVGTILAGAVGGGHRVAGQDAKDLQAWREAYLSVGAELSDWLALTQAVEHTLALWARNSLVNQAADRAAEILCQAGHLRSRAAVESLLGAVGIQGIPEPIYTVNTPTAQHWGLTTPAHGEVPQRPTARGAGARAATAKVTTAQDGWRTCCNTKFTWGHALDCPHQR